MSAPRATHRAPPMSSVHVVVRPARVTVRGRSQDREAEPSRLQASASTTRGRTMPREYRTMSAAALAGEPPSPASTSTEPRIGPAHPTPASPASR